MVEHCPDYSGGLYQRALEEASITERVRNASWLLRAAARLETLARFGLKNKKTAFASFCAMGTMALLPEVLNICNLDSSLASTVSSQVLPLAAGAMTGDYWGPASTIIDKVRETRALEELKEPVGEDRVLRRSLALLCADYSNVIRPSVINDYLRRGRYRKEYQDDPRLEAVGLIHQSLHPEKPEEAPKTLRQKRRQERQDRKETVIFSLRSQILGQKIRRLDSHIRAQVLKKIADWGLGAVGIGSLAALVNSKFESTTAAGLAGLLDDAVALGSLFLSPTIKRVLSLFTSNKIKASSLSTISIREDHSPSLVKGNYRPPVRPFDHAQRRE